VRIDTGTDVVRAEIREGVGVVTLNRPDRRNALHPDMYEQVPVVLERFEADPDVGCILVTATGSAFCAGGDVRDGGDARGGPPGGDGADAEPTPPPTVEQAGAALAQSARMVVMLHESAKVTIAALNGPAVGAGIGIALSTDLRVAAKSARFVPGWGRLGFSGDFGGTWFLTRLLGPSRALQFFVDNAEIDAASALELGLVNEVVPDAELAGAAFARAQRVAAGPRAAWSLFKENVRDALALDLRDALGGESERMIRSGRTEDHRDAVKAWFLEAKAKAESRRSPD
jgi:2-(1,2-epoxy-1,2-dihydrophenyl)acetyl-CoA isomerase